LEKKYREQNVEKKKGQRTKKANDCQMQKREEQRVKEKGERKKKKQQMKWKQEI
jgi:hypothetical protein